MKTHLLYKNQDLNLDVPLPVNSEDITADLELNTLFNAMSLDDDFIFNVVEHAVLSSAGESDIETIQFRQDILKDCLKNQKIVREIYQIPIESLNRKRKSWLGIFLRYPAGILNNSIQLMKLFFELLHRLRGIADDYSGQFESEGFTRFFEMIKTELSDDYFALMETHVKNLEFRGGVMISANLGKGNEGDQLVLRLPNKMEGSWFKRLFRRRSPTFGFFISGARRGRYKSSIRIERPRVEPGCQCTRPIRRSH